jgi:hypothetical protein
MSYTQQSEVMSAIMLLTFVRSPCNIVTPIPCFIQLASGICGVAQVEAIKLFEVVPLVFMNIAVDFRFYYPCIK